MTVLQTSRLCLILGCLALLYFVHLFQMNGIYLVSSGFPPFEKVRQRVRRIMGKVPYRWRKEK